MNKMNVNRTLSIVKAVPVILGLGVLTYKGIGFLSNKIKERNSDKKIDTLSLELSKTILTAGYKESDLSTITKTLHTYNREKDVECIILLLETYCVPKSDYKAFIKFIDNVLNIK